MFACQFAQDEVTHQRRRVSSKKHARSLPEGSVQQGAAIFTRGAYAEYVSTEKWRERRWRLFLTDPLEIFAMLHGLGETR
jgi:hypothetical protein